MLSYKLFLSCRLPPNLSSCLQMSLFTYPKSMLFLLSLLFGPVNGNCERISLNTELHTLLHLRTSCIKVASKDSAPCEKNLSKLLKLNFSNSTHTDCTVHVFDSSQLLWQSVPSWGPILTLALNLHVPRVLQMVALVKPIYWGQVLCLAPHITK